MLKKYLSALFVCLLTVATCFGCNKADYKKALKVENYDYEMVISNGTSNVTVKGSTNEGSDKVLIYVGESTEAIEEYYEVKNTSYRYYFNKTQNWSEGAIIYQYSYKSAEAKQHIDVLKAVGEDGIDSKGKLTEVGETNLKAWAPRIYGSNHTLDNLVGTTTEIKDFKLTVNGDKVTKVSFTLVAGSTNYSVSVKYSNHNKSAAVEIPTVITPYEG